MLASSLGCVRRRLTVRTLPAGADVYVDKQLIGKSPTSTSVTYYGTREFEVVRDGYRTEKVLRAIRPPWYQIPPLDFISETLWPWEIRDERVIDIEMVPQQLPNSEDLQFRADGMRLQASQGVAVYPPQVGSTNDPLLGDPQFGSSPSDFNSGFPGAAGTPLPQASPPGSGLQNTPQWQPGRVLGEIFSPDGQAPTNLPGVGGSYRPEMSGN